MSENKTDTPRTDNGGFLKHSLEIANMTVACQLERIEDLKAQLAEARAALKVRPAERRMTMGKANDLTATAIKLVEAVAVAKLDEKNKEIAELKAQIAKLKDDVAVPSNWTPPELQDKKWVDAPVRRASNGTNTLAFYHPSHANLELALEGALRMCDFMGYVYADGLVHAQPRFPLADSTEPAAIPVAVRFWTGGGE